MVKSIVVGLIAQVVLAVAFLAITEVTFAKNQVFKATLLHSIAGLVACLIVALFFLPDLASSMTLAYRGAWYLVLLAGVSLVVGDILLIIGISLSNVTAVAYTALAYPGIVLILETLLGRTAPTWQDLAGFVFLAIGFILVANR
jgi:drug/metabolite transporter (DMT)-like permease